MICMLMIGQDYALCVPKQGVHNFLFFRSRRVECLRIVFGPKNSCIYVNRVSKRGKKHTAP